MVICGCEKVLSPNFAFKHQIHFSIFNITYVTKVGR